MLTLWAHAAYATRHGHGRLALTFLVFRLGLLAKPMLVTLPLVMLLLDYWPVHRGVRIPGKAAILQRIRQAIGCNLDSPSEA